MCAFCGDQTASVHGGVRMTQVVDGSDLDDWGQQGACPIVDQLARQRYPANYPAATFTRAGVDSATMIKKFRFALGDL